MVWRYRKFVQMEEKQTAAVATLRLEAEALEDDHKENALDAIDVVANELAELWGLGQAKGPVVDDHFLREKFREETFVPHPRSRYSFPWAPNGCPP